MGSLGCSSRRIDVMQQYAPSKPHDRMRECRTCAHFKGRTTGIVQGFKHLQGDLVYC